MAVLFAWCDLLVDAADWAGLEPRAADALALAVRLRDPVSLAVAQRHLGLAWVEQGRALEAAELLAAALPVVRRHVPELVGPTAWALGNASLELDAVVVARTVFTEAAEAFEAADRLEEASHARYRAGTAAWDGDDLATAGRDLDAAVALARRSRTLPVLLEALRSRAAVRAADGDVDGGIAALDAVLDDAAELAATLRLLADKGHDGFYRGPLAERLVEGVRAAGGIWTLDDLAGYRTVEREPLRFAIDTRHELIGAPPPSAGGLILAQSLGLLQRLDWRASDGVERSH
ncbi:MAG: gamma-glutamyltransferase, partial [Micrococcales bacterium]|nr:gamma-glutamyltransferase [Micrococcales bacterium]